MTLLSYLVHSGHKYKLIQESDSSLKIVVENQSGQQAEATVNNVDCASFRLQLEPLSKSNTAPPTNHLQKVLKRLFIVIAVAAAHHHLLK